METKKFANRIAVDERTGCWIWTGAQNGSGYGSAYSPRLKRTITAHRFIYEEHKGQIPEGLSLDHLCRTPLCVNPDHLEAVTHRENIRRGLTGARQRAQTHCKRGHGFTLENTRITTNGSRECRACGKLRTQLNKFGRTKSPIPKPPGWCGKGHHQMRGDNLYIHPTTGVKTCRACARVRNRRSYKAWRERNGFA